MSVPPVVLIPLAGGDYLALTQAQFAEARALGKQLAGDAQPAASEERAEPLSTAEQIEELTKIPASWFLEQARKGAVPHVRLGKYVRFRFSEVAPCAAKRNGSGKG